MSFSSRSYSKEARSSSSYYARSSSYHASSSNTGYLNSSSGYALTDIDRPLSTRLIERDYSLPSLAWDFDDPFFFDRYRWRFGDDLFRLNYGLRRAIPITYRTYSKSSSSIQIPVQYQPSISFNRRRHVSRRSDNDSSSSLLNRQDESSMRRENRISCDDWPPKQDPATRKRSSMTIFIQRPYVDLTEVPYYRKTQQTPTYPQSARLDYY